MGRATRASETEARPIDDRCHAEQCLNFQKIDICPLLVELLLGARQMRGEVMLVRLANGDIGEEEARATHRTRVVEHVVSTEKQVDAEITPQLSPNKFYDVQFHRQVLATSA